VERRGLKVFLDTHAAIFLWEGRVEVFGRASRELIDRAVLLISPLVRLELWLLREVGKLTVEPGYLLDGLATEMGVAEPADPLPAVVAQAQPLAWTRDPFDRLIVATAMLHHAPLITRDRVINLHYPECVW